MYHPLPANETEGFLFLKLSVPNFGEHFSGTASFKLWNIFKNISKQHSISHIPYIMHKTVSGNKH